MERPSLKYLNDAANLLTMIKIGRKKEYNEESVLLYPGGFNAKSFVDVIEYSKIWEGINEN